jgi:hypothetical protein
MNLELSQAVISRLKTAKEELDSDLIRSILELPTARRSQYQHQQLVVFFSQLTFFRERDTNLRALSDFVSKFELLYLPASKCVMKHGDSGDLFYIILRGQVSIWLPIPKKKHSHYFSVFQKSDPDASDFTFWLDSAPCSAKNLAVKLPALSDRAEADQIGFYKEFKARVFKEISKLFHLFQQAGIQQSNQKDVDIVFKNLRKIAKSKTVSDEFKPERS